MLCARNSMSATCVIICKVTSAFRSNASQFIAGLDHNDLTLCTCVLLQDAHSSDAGKCMDLQFCTVKIGGERHARSQSPLLIASTCPTPPSMSPISPQGCTSSMSCDVLTNNSRSVSNFKPRRRLLTLSNSSESAPTRPVSLCCSVVVINF